ncbi:MAG: ATP-binding protein [bacterium]|nr:ATP-binding protein [bacterium]
MTIHQAGYIPREIEETLRELLRQFPAVGLTGPRQSGKSTLLKEVFGETYHIISFDDPLDRERATSDPKLFIESAGERIIFDEIQYAPEILSYIKILIDSNRNKRGRFIITGSQQFSLIKGLGDTLAGRIGLLDLLPFSLKEKRRIPSLRKRLISTQSYFEDCCLRGSFPEITLQSEIDSNTWYGSYLQTYLERDIRTIYNIGILREFQQFVRLLAGRCSQILNMNNLASDLGVSVNTIKRWLSILEASRIIYTLPPYYRNLGKRITKNPKIYFLDLGLVCYLTGVRSKELLWGGPLAGPLFENFIIQETIKYFFNRGIRPNIFYLRTHNNLEIDLIIESNLTLFPFEIKLTKTPNVGMASPIERFNKIFSKLKISPGKIISLSEDNIPLTENVSVVSVDSYLESLVTAIISSSPG